MQRRIPSLLLALAASLACQPATRDRPEDELSRSLPITRAPRGESGDKLSPVLRRLVQSRAVGPRVRVLVDHSVQLDLLRFGDTLRRAGADRRERRRRVVRALKLIASQSQSGLHSMLEKMKERGTIDSYRPISIVNGVVVTGTPSAIRELAAREDVAEIIEESTREALVVTAADAILTGPPPTRSWALDALGIDSLWQAGLTGRGTVVGIIDTGATAIHEQLRGNFRGGPNSWHDPVGQSTTPRDSRLGHGTTVLSVAVGQNLGGKVLGVAPDAEWIACAGIPEGRYNNIAFAECADWMLTTGQPDVLINPWLLPSRGCDRSLQRIVDAWRAAEILPVFSAGNDGPTPQGNRSPANYTGLYPGGAVTLSVGGTTRSADLLDTSSRGPNNCDGSIFPTLVAPAEDVLAAFPLTPSTYTQAEGTSVAAGLTAGAAALLLQQEPEASVTDLESLLGASAADLGPAGADNAFGYGQLQPLAALESLLSRKGRQATATSTEAP